MTSFNPLWRNTSIVKLFPYKPFSSPVLQHTRHFKSKVWTCIFIYTKPCRAFFFYLIFSSIVIFSFLCNWIFLVYKYCGCLWLPKCQNVTMDKITIRLFLKNGVLGNKGVAGYGAVYYFIIFLFVCLARWNFSVCVVVYFSSTVGTVLFEH